MAWESTIYENNIDGFQQDQDQVLLFKLPNRKFYQKKKKFTKKFFKSQK